MPFQTFAPECRTNFMPRARNAVVKARTVMGGCPNRPRPCGVRCMKVGQWLKKVTLHACPTGHSERFLAL